MGLDPAVALQEAAGQGCFPHGLRLYREDTAHGGEGSRRCLIKTDERALEGIQILLVDDNDDARYILERVFEHEGAVVVAAAGGREALESLRQVQAHVIVSDLSMPGMDGITFIQQVRALPGQGERPTPAIAVTAYPETQHREQVLAAGFDVYLVKPVAPGVVIQEIVRLVQAGRERRGAPEPDREGAD